MEKINKKKLIEKCDNEGKEIISEFMIAMESKINEIIDYINAIEIDKKLKEREDEIKEIDKIRKKISASSNLKRDN